MTTELLDASQLKIELEKDHNKKRIGLVALATDHTSERDFFKICPTDLVEIFINRITYANPTTKENLLKTGVLLTEAAETILPDEKLDTIAYACTAASVVLGDEMVEGFLQKGKADSHYVTPASAARAAFKLLGLKKISILAPYSKSVTQELVDYFERYDIEVVSATGLGFEDDREMARIPSKTLAKAGCIAMSDEAEGLFISCTALRAVDAIESIESKLGRPVVTANQATIWHSLRLAGVTDPIEGYGALFRHVG